MEKFFEIAAEQGFSVLLLVIAVIYFYKRQQSWESKIEVINLERVKERVQMATLNEELKIIIEQNTASQKESVKILASITEETKHNTEMQKQLMEIMKATIEKLSTANAAKVR